MDVPIKRERRRWLAAELRYLDRWAGIRPLRMLCGHLQRTERALRCKLHRLELSAKVREGWALKEVCAQCQLSARTILGCVIQGTMRLQSAQVRTRLSIKKNKKPGREVPRRWRLLAHHNRPIGEVGALLHLTATQICAASLQGHLRLVHVRITEGSVPSYVPPGRNHHA